MHCNYERNMLLFISEIHENGRTHPDEREYIDFLSGEGEQPFDENVFDEMCRQLKNILRQKGIFKRR